MIAGARGGTLSGLRRLAAAAMARDLRAIIVPGPEVARARGLDIESAGLRIAATPRHANVLLLVGPVPRELGDAVTVLYAQMMRPRAILSLETDGTPSPLPHADVAAERSQSGLVDGVNRLRSAFSRGAFRPGVSDFDAPALQIRIEYTCPMHPEVVQDQPGSCPKCGMTLVPREAQATAEPHHGAHHDTEHDVPAEYTCPMHPEVVQDRSGSCPKCGMNLVPRDIQVEATHTPHQHMVHTTPAEYTCPMHPEVVQDQPGSCPKCGMTLVPREAQATVEPPHGTHHDMGHAAPAAYTCPMHPEVVQDQPGSCPKCGMTLVPREAQASVEPHHGAHHGMAHAAPAAYTCPMHPEVVQDQPGSCPKCGMNLVLREPGPADEQEQAPQNADMDPGDMDFMSMVEVTKDLPRSPDGLPMDWIEVPFGPFFPGLPGGLLLTLTLDGDGIARARAQSLTGGSGALPAPDCGAADFVDHLGATDPLAPVGYRLLACRALEAAAGQIPDEEILRGRIAAVERERIASHLGWLALFARQIGFDWLLRRAASLQLQFLHADMQQVMALNPAVQALIKRLQRTPLLKSRTAGIGRMPPDAALRGPVARATGIGDDARSRDKTCSALGFTAVSREGGDALARLHVRLDEIRHSLALIEAAGVIVPPAPVDIGEASGAGEAVVETPRGEARLQLTLDNGRVSDARLDTPSTHHLDWVAQLLERQELGDGLTTVASLDLSPWEVVQ